jgi:hypothetical protein
VPVSRCVIPVVLAVCTLAPVWGQSASPGSGTLLDALFRESGLEACVGFSPEAVEALIEAEREGMEAEAFGLFAGAMRAGLDRDAMRADARAGLARVLDADSAAAALEWLRTPLGRRMVAMEVAAAEADEEEAADYVAATDFSTPQGERRFTLAVDFLETIGSAGLFVNLTMEMLEAMLRALMLASGEDDEDALFEVLDALQAQLSENARALALVSTLHAYREASLDDLEAYLAFLRTDLGQWYVYATSEAASEAFSEVGARIGAAVGSAARAAE